MASRLRWPLRWPRGWVTRTMRAPASRWSYHLFQATLPQRQVPSQFPGCRTCEQKLQNVFVAGSDSRARHARLSSLLPSGWAGVPSTAGVLKRACDLAIEAAVAFVASVCRLEIHIRRVALAVVDTAVGSRIDR